MTHYTKFKEYVKMSKANTRFLRYKFNKRAQGETETLELFYTDLKLLAIFCNVGTCREERLTDRIVFGINSDKIRERLIEKGSDLKLNKAVGRMNFGSIEINGTRYQ